MTELRQRQPRERDDKFLAFLRLQPCCVCSRPAPSEAAHIRMADPLRGKRETGKGEKPSDRYAVPLCGPIIGAAKGCHREQHSMDEMAFWKMHEINPFVVADSYYAIGGGNSTTAKPRPKRKRKPTKRSTQWASRKIQNRKMK